MPDTLDDFFARRRLSPGTVEQVGAPPPSPVAPPLPATPVDDFFARRRVSGVAAPARTAMPARSGAERQASVEERYEERKDELGMPGEVRKLLDKNAAFFKGALSQATFQNKPPDPFNPDETFLGDLRDKPIRGYLAGLAEMAGFTDRIAVTGMEGTKLKMAGKVVAGLGLGIGAGAGFAGAKGTAAIAARAPGIIRGLVPGAVGGAVGGGLGAAQGTDLSDPTAIATGALMGTGGGILGGPLVEATSRAGLGGAIAANLGYDAVTGAAELTRRSPELVEKLTRVGYGGLAPEEKKQLLAEIAMSTTASVAGSAVGAAQGVKGMRDVAAKAAKAASDKAAVRASLAEMQAQRRWRAQKRQDQEAALQRRLELNEGRSGTTDMDRAVMALERELGFPGLARQADNPVVREDWQGQPTGPSPRQARVIQEQEARSAREQEALDFAVTREGHLRRQKEAGERTAQRRKQLRVDERNALIQDIREAQSTRAGYDDTNLADPARMAPPRLDVPIAPDTPYIRPEIDRAKNVAALRVAAKEAGVSPARLTEIEADTAVPKGVGKRAARLAALKENLSEELNKAEYAPASKAEPEFDATKIMPVNPALVGAKSVQELRAAASDAGLEVWGQRQLEANMDLPRGKGNEQARLEALRRLFSNALDARLPDPPDLPPPGAPVRPPVDPTDSPPAGGSAPLPVPKAPESVVDAAIADARAALPPKPTGDAGRNALDGALSNQSKNLTAKELEAEDIDLDYLSGLLGEKFVFARKEADGTISLESLSPDKKGGLPSVVPVKKIGRSPDDFQHKLDTDERGLNNPLKGEYDREAAGIIHIYQRLDGSYVVVNGHHRLAHAEDNIPDGNMLAYVWKEADGWTPQMAKARGAALNLKDHKGSIYDQADYIRYHAGTLAKADLDSIGGRARTIAENATDDVYNAFTTERIPEGHAEVIAAAGAGKPDIQELGLYYQEANPHLTASHLGRTLSELSRLPDDQVAAMASNRRAKKNQPDSLMPDMFEDMMDVANALGEARQQLDGALTTRINIFGRVIKNPEEAAAGGYIPKDLPKLTRLRDELVSARARVRAQSSFDDIEASVQKQLRVMTKELGANEQPSFIEKILAKEVDTVGTASTGKAASSSAIRPEFVGLRDIKEMEAVAQSLGLTRTQIKKIQKDANLPTGTGTKPARVKALSELWSKAVNDLEANAALTARAPRDAAAEPTRLPGEEPTLAPGSDASRAYEAPGMGGKFDGDGGSPVGGGRSGRVDRPLDVEYYHKQIYRAPSVGDVVKVAREAGLTPAEVKDARVKAAWPDSPQPQASRSKASRSGASGGSDSTARRPARPNPPKPTPVDQKGYVERLKDYLVAKLRQKEAIDLLPKPLRERIRTGRAARRPVSIFHDAEIGARVDAAHGGQKKALGDSFADVLESLYRTMRRTGDFMYTSHLNFKARGSKADEQMGTDLNDVRHRLQDESVRKSVEMHNQVVRTVENDPELLYIYENLRMMKQAAEFDIPAQRAAMQAKLKAAATGKDGAEQTNLGYDLEEVKLPFGLTEDVTIQEWNRMRRFLDGEDLFDASGNVQFKGSQERGAKVREALEIQEKYFRDRAERHEALGLLPEGTAARNPYYFHHKVEADLRAAEEAIGRMGMFEALRSNDAKVQSLLETRKNMVRLQKEARSYQKRRKGSKADYRSDVLAIDLLTMKQMETDIVAAEFAMRIQGDTDFNLLPYFKKLAASEGWEEGGWRKAFTQSEFTKTHEIYEYDKRGGVFSGKPLDMRILENEQLDIVAKQLSEASGETVLPSDIIPKGPEGLMIIPKDLAAQLRDMNNTGGGAGGSFNRVLSKATSILKYHMLFNFMRRIPYTVNNVIGDTSAMFTIQPGTLLHMKSSLQEVYRAGKGDLSADVREAYDFGVMGSGQAGAELPATLGSLTRRRLTDQDLTLVQKAAASGPVTTGNVLWKLFKKLAWDSSGSGANEFRENVFRLAAYKYYKKNPGESGVLRAGRRDALQGNQAAAAKARELLIDYANTSVATQAARATLIPFANFTLPNAARYTRAFKNHYHDGATAGYMGMTGAAGGLASQLGMIGRAFLLLNAASVVGMLIHGGMDNYDDARDELGAYDRSRSSLPLWLGKDGMRRFFRIRTDLDDIMDWVGAREFPRLYQDLKRGRDLMDVAKEIGWAPVNKLTLSINPLYQTAYTAASGNAVFPKPFDQRANTVPLDENVATIFGMQNPYTEVKNLWNPEPKPGEDGIVGAVKRNLPDAMNLKMTDPGQTAMSDTYGAIQSWQKRIGVEKSASVRPGRQTQLVRDMVYARRVEDVKEEGRLKELLLAEMQKKEELGLTSRRMSPQQKIQNALDRAYPFGGVPDKTVKAFLSEATAEERERVVKMIDHFIETYSPSPGERNRARRVQRMAERGNVRVDDQPIVPGPLPARFR